MHFVLAIAGLPAYGNHGGAQTCMGIVRAMRSAGHNVTVVSLFETSSSNPYREHRQQNEQYLRNNNVNVVYIEHDYHQLKSQLGNGISNQSIDSLIATAYPWALLQSRVSAVMGDIQADAVFCYHFEPLAAFYGLDSVPKLVGIGDPSHTIFKAMFNAKVIFPIRDYFKMWLMVRKKKKHYILKKAEFY